MTVVASTEADPLSKVEAVWPVVSSMGMNKPERSLTIGDVIFFFVFRFHASFGVFLIKT